MPAAREEAAREGIQAAIWSQLGTTLPVVLHVLSASAPAWRQRGALWDL